MTNTIFTEKGQLIARLQAQGIKPSKAVIRLDAELPEWTRAELKELYEWLTLDLLSDPETTPAERRELLSTMDVCPCCDRWLGHNKPPADDGDSPYRRQTAFDFDR